MKKLNLISSILILSSAAALQAQTVSVDKASLSFFAQAGGAAVTQPLTVSSAGTGSNQFFVSAPGSTPWLKVNGASSIGGAPPATVTISADPTGLTAGTYNSNLTVFGTTGPSLTVPVTFSVGSIGASPSSVTFAYQLNGALPSATSVTLTSTSSIAYTIATSVVSGPNWLAAAGNGTSPGTVSVGLNSGVVTSLAAGTYNGSVTITPSVGPAISIPVTLTVTAAPTVTASASAINLNYQVGGATGSTNSPTATFTLTNPGTQPVPFAIFSLTSTGSWLSSTSPDTSIPAGGSSTITVSYLTATNLAQNTYTGSVRILLSNAANTQIDVPVSLRISISPLLTVPSATLAFTYQIGGSTPAAKSVTATSTQAAADAAIGLQMPLSLIKTNNSTWLTIPATGTTGTATPITISVNPAGLAVGTYNDTISIIGGGAANNPVTIPVSLTVSNDPLIVASFGGCSTANVACQLAFPIQVGMNSPTTQNVKAASSTGVQASFAATATMATSAACGTTWLSTGATAAVIGTEATFAITVTPGSIAAGTTCTGTVTITGTNPATGLALPNSPVTIPVTMYVSATSMLVANPIALNFALGSNATSTQSLTVTSTSAAATTPVNLDFNATASSSASWLLAFPLARNTTPGSNTVTVAVNSSGLNPGTYNAAITLTATAPGVLNSPVTIPVTLTVTAATMTVTPTTLTFQQVRGGSAPAAKTFTVSTNSTDIAYTTTVAMTEGSGWLLATPSGTATSSTPSTATVSVNGSALAAGTYHGTVTVTSPLAAGSPAVVNVTLEVLAGTVSASPTSLTFTQVQGGTAPAAQTLAVNGTQALNYTVAVTTANNSGNWLQATPLSGTTNSNVQISVNSGLLPAGQYTGKVTITSTGASGSPLDIPVTLNVTSPVSMSVTPTTLNFSYTLGASTTPQAQTVQLSSTAGVAFTAAATTTGGGPWLVVAPTSGSGSGTLTVSINAAAITGAGNFTGTVAISSPAAATNPAATVTVNLTVTAVPKPVITSIANAASYVSGAVSPGENIVIFGSGIGPATLTMGTVANNTFATTIASTQVFFDNLPAPILYVSGVQTSVMVPYGISGRATTNIRIVYSGVQSDTLVYNVTTTTPGIYTANSSGSGQGSILNQDYSYNGAVGVGTKPAEKNSVVAIYMTGEGITVPGGSDGVIAPSNGTGLYKPILPVTATVGGAPAVVEYYGTAPGILYGVMQVNVRIPANAASGSLDVVISVGQSNTQPNVKVTVQ